MGGANNSLTLTPCSGDQAGEPGLPAPPGGLPAPHQLQQLLPGCARWAIKARHLRLSACLPEGHTDTGHGAAGLLGEVCMLQSVVRQRRVDSDWTSLPSWRDGGASHTFSRSQGLGGFRATKAVTRITSHRAPLPRVGACCCRRAQAQALWPLWPPQPLLFLGKGPPAASAPCGPEGEQGRCQCPCCPWASLGMKGGCLPLRSPLSRQPRWRSAPCSSSARTWGCWCT